jgi:hypothetical protein
MESQEVLKTVAERKLSSNQIIQIRETCFPNDHFTKVTSPYRWGFNVGDLFYRSIFTGMIDLS